MFDIYADDLVKLRVLLIAQVVTGAWTEDMATQAIYAADSLDYLAKRIESGPAGAATFAPLDATALADALKLLAHHKRAGTLPETKAKPAKAK